MGQEPSTRDSHEKYSSSMLESDDEDAGTPLSLTSSRAAPSSMATPTRRPRRRSGLSRSNPRSIRTPSNSTAPASPPTPAPSPSPHQRLPDWSTADEGEEVSTRDIRRFFKEASEDQRKRLLAELMNMCDNRLLTFVHDFVCPRLKKDPFAILPTEICLRILSYVDHPRTLARSSQVSRRWHELVNDDMAWKSLCEKHAYRRMSNESDDDEEDPRRPRQPVQDKRRSEPPFTRLKTSSLVNKRFAPLLHNGSSSAPDLTTSTLDSAKSGRGRARFMSYRSHFKRRYMVETAWRSGGKVESRHITPDQGVVTSLHLTSKYIVVALDNAKIHVFDAGGAHQKTLHGHIMGVWAMVPWGDILVSGGCDRDVRVWNMATGQNLHVLRGHSSTVRCLKMSNSTTAITGSRDTTLRIWDISRGVCTHVLIGHQASVRCLEVHGDLVASGSYDTTARIWSISEGKCLRVLSGHFSQIYAIAFDGRRIATGSLDTSVRIWDPTDGKCLAVLQGHTSLVGQLQMRGDTLVTGGSDGSVRVWSLERLVPIHRLAAHDNSVTSLQFNESRIVSGGSDGRVKVWDTRRGSLVRELSQPADAVWRVVFEEEKAIIMANRNQRTVMEVWSFSPPEEELQELSRSSSSSPAGHYSVADGAAASTMDRFAGDAKTADVEMPDAPAPENTTATATALREGRRGAGAGRKRLGS